MASPSPISPTPISPMSPATKKKLLMQQTDKSIVQQTKLAVVIYKKELPPEFKLVARLISPTTKKYATMVPRPHKKALFHKPHPAHTMTCRIF
eukprot:gene13411-542_t